jgi:hypothetical protein
VNRSAGRVASGHGFLRAGGHWGPNSRWYAVRGPANLRSARVDPLCRDTPCGAVFDAQTRPSKIDGAGASLPIYTGHSRRDPKVIFTSSPGPITHPRPGPIQPERLCRGPACERSVVGRSIRAQLHGAFSNLIVV